MHDGHTLVGICLIRLEDVRPKGVPAALGVSSENAAHRIAVEWTGPDGQSREGVFVARRDTNSRLNAFAGGRGRIFPGEQHHSRFEVRDQDPSVSIEVTSRDAETSILVNGRTSETFPSSSCFESLAEASRFFESGGLGYSVTKDADRLDGLELRTTRWQVVPFEIKEVRSSFFSDHDCFPRESVVFDHCLLMRDIEHEWHSVDDFCIPPESP